MASTRSTRAIVVSTSVLTLVVLSPQGLAQRRGPGPAATTVATPITSAPEVQPRPGTVRIDLSRIKAMSIAVQTPAGVETTAAAAPDKIDVHPWQYVVAKTGTQISSVAAPVGKQAWSLPTLISTADETGAQLDLEVVVAVDNGLMLRDDGTVFSGDIFVGLIDTKQRASTRALGAPVNVLFTGPVLAIDPSEGVLLNHLSQPFARVSLKARSEGDSVVLKARTAFAEVDVPIPVMRPRLILGASPGRVQGYGFEAVEVTVQAEGLANPEGMTVTLDATRGRIEPSRMITLNAQGVASAQLRSEGQGTAVVSATAGVLRAPEPRTVEFVAPVSFLLWAVGGGLLGGFARLLAKKRRLSPRASTRAVTAGVLLGLLVALAYTQGVKLLAVIPTASSGQALVAMIAALTAVIDPAEQIKRITTGVSGKDS